MTVLTVMTLLDTEYPKKINLLQNLPKSKSITECINIVEIVRLNWYKILLSIYMLGFSKIFKGYYLDPAS